MKRSLVLLVCAAGCGKGDASGGPGRGRPAMAFPVEVEDVASRKVEYTVGAVGSVEAFEIVQATARVAGVVDRVLFNEGQVVPAGQPLVEIEPTRYKLAVDAARAALQRADAAHADAEAGLKRREDALQQSPGVILGEELETWRTRSRTSEAEAASGRVALEQAELNLRDAYVRAPVAGIIQTRTVNTGQYVQPGTVLATMVRRDPLLLRFQVSEQDAARLKPGMNARFAVPGGADNYLARISHVAGSADLSSRMVSVTARVEDPRRGSLRPGTFAEVTVPVGASREAPVIPQTAVRPSERGFLAYVVEDGAAKMRVLQLGMRTADGRVEVRSGLEAGEKLVVRGAEALRDGVPVRVAGEKPAPDAGAPQVGP